MPATASRHKFSADLYVEDREAGLLVSQGDQAYVARNWKLTPSTTELIETAIASDLGCMIRDDHPRRNARLPNERGVVYLAFSPSSDVQWSLAIDTFRAARGDYGVAVFNGKYHQQFVARGIPFTFEGRNKGAGHLVVARKNVLFTLRSLAMFDHSVLALNRTTHAGEGFTTEYVLQRQILTNWANTPWADRYDLVQDEFPVDGGMTSRRIDILARDRRNGDWLIIELKRAEASLPAVHQVADYLLALGRRDDFACCKLAGALVAERVPRVVRAAARNEGIHVFEASWPCMLEQV